jgi:hypothetical protein
MVTFGLRKVIPYDDPDLVDVTEGDQHDVRAIRPHFA